ncbi:RdgB/HAM1 family non-canonical purine NTP pyrophosphatase [Spongisporangium articulatum]|uniref:dITP/XTP pyrophosphatase n=1 Tax=Spongisporangium articulatum TaxID=3362603 RepID=A0ABW8AK59_9ACTN
MRVVLATRNAHKVGELRRILGGLDGARDLEVVGLPDDAPDVVEDGVTFAENALLKARSAATATGLPAIADDSGISVDVLGGAPGVFSARWAGTHGDDAANLALLLAQLGDVPDAHRGARFVCAAALALPAGPEHVVIGEMTGRLTREPFGGGGFGYDPIFVADGGRRTNAELSAEEKDAISHRGKAFRELAAQLPELLAATGA